MPVRVLVTEGTRADCAEAGALIKRSLQRGFTLVELAIVLVIAGIILVSVLKGRGEGFVYLIK